MSSQYAIPIKEFTNPAVSSKIIFKNLGLEPASETYQDWSLLESFDFSANYQLCYPTQSLDRKEVCEEIFDSFSLWFAPFLDSEKQVTKINFAEIFDHKNRKILLRGVMEVCYEIFELYCLSWFNMKYFTFLSRRLTKIEGRKSRDKVPVRYKTYIFL